MKNVYCVLFDQKISDDAVFSSAEKAAQYLGRNFGREIKGFSFPSVVADVKSGHGQTFYLPTGKSVSIKKIAVL